MGYSSYGHELVVSVVLLLSFFSLVLDILPLLYKRLRESIASAPLRFGTGFILILTACFLI